MLRVDYHFHPNLPKDDTKALALCESHWKSFLRAGINCVVVTEHVYKNPKRAYDFMIKTMPKNCFCFPGMEYLTKGGIDIVLFSEKPDIYKLRILKPFSLTFHQLLDFLPKHKKIYSFVTHPYTLGVTSIIDHTNHEQYLKAVNYLGAVEISNGSYD